MNSSHFHPTLGLDDKALFNFSVLGRALYTAQHLEMNLRALVGYIKMRQYPNSPDDPDLQIDIEELWKRTLGQNASYLKSLGLVDQNVSRILSDATGARNDIAHSITVGIETRADFDSREIMNQIKLSIRKIAVADKLISVILTFLNKEPLPSRSFLIAYENQVIDWVFAPASYH